MQLNIDEDYFQQQYKNGVAQVVSLKLIADLETPVSVMLKLKEKGGYSFLLESVEGGQKRGRYSVIGIEPDLLFMIKGKRALISKPSPGQSTFNARQFTELEQPPLTALRQIIAESQINLPPDLPPMAAGIFGYFGYDIIRFSEPTLTTARASKPNLPDALLIRPSVIIIFDSLKNEIVLATPVRPTSHITPVSAYATARDKIMTVASKIITTNISNRAYVIQPAKNGAPVFKSNMTAQRYCSLVDKARQYILAGDIFQVVLSQRFSCPFKVDPFYLYRALRLVNPSPYLYHLAFNDFTITGSSPEILVKSQREKDRHRITIRPLAGTRKRGRDDDEDNILAHQLLNDPKELAEHLMLLDLGRNDVGRISTIGSVQVDEKFAIERYSHVMHIVSQVSGILNDDEYDNIDALFAGFPAGTVSGAPKIRAMQIIDELEVDGRGSYAGCVGYFSANGDMDSCITLRTSVIKDGTMYVQAGAGIVANSQPEEENSECHNKAMGLFKAAAEAIKMAASD